MTPRYRGLKISLSVLFIYLVCCHFTQESDLIENVEEEKDSDITKSEEEKSKVQVMSLYK